MCLRKHVRGSISLSRGCERDSEGHNEIRDLFGSILYLGLVSKDEISISAEKVIYGFDGFQLGRINQSNGIF